jgi:hypothetical protein
VSSGIKVILVVLDFDNFMGIDGVVIDVVGFGIMG